MKEISAKKIKRIENKRKKMLAELEICKLNDRDRQARDSNATSKRERNLRNDSDDSVSQTKGTEPKCKRPKKEQVVDCADSNSTDSYPLTRNNTTLVYGEELEQLRKALRDRAKVLRAIPRLRLKSSGDDADLSQVTRRTPIFFSDIQHLLMYSQLGSHSPYDPRWVLVEKCSKLSHTVFIIVEGASVYDYISSESVCPNLAKMNVRVELVSPFSYGGSIVEELCAVPLSKTQKLKLEKRFGNLNDAVQSSDKVFRVLRSMFPIKHSLFKAPNRNNVKQSINLPATDKFSRTDLLLSAWQLVEEGYPLPLRGELSTRYSKYVLTKDKYREVTPHSPMWAVDCEMCQTMYGNELTRISIVNEKLEVMYESLVKPYSTIINYLTQYSGITRAMLKDVTKRLEDVQADLRALLPADVILVGQSLNMDLHAMRMMHPYIIDTSVIYNLSGDRRRKSKLAVICQLFLNEAIQQSMFGHDSVEDSSAALRLVQLKLSKSLEFGDAVLCGPHNISDNGNNISQLNDENNEQNVSQSNVNDFSLATSLFSHVASQNKTVSLISSSQTLAEYSPFITAATFAPGTSTQVECHIVNSNTEAIDKTIEEISQHEFCMTHVKLQEPENITTVDDWVSRVLKNGANNSLVMVVLAGSTNSSSSHGAAFLQVQALNPLLK